MRPNFDGIAHPYRWMESLSFGPWLQRCRVAHLERLGDPRRALVLGDGDGRFLARLLQRYPLLEADAVDGSRAMSELARQRAKTVGAGARARFHVADARAFLPLAPARYDLVCAHFFLDCLTEREVSALFEGLAPRLAANATLLVSEFAIPAHGPVRPAARLLVAALYLAFRLLTGLQARRLPDYAAVLRRAGFTLGHATPLLGGLLRSERWLRALDPAPADFQAK